MMTLQFPGLKSTLSNLPDRLSHRDRPLAPSHFLLPIATLSLTSLFLPTPATHAQIPRISPQDLGIPTESQRFFSQGREQFAQEIDRLETRSLAASDPLQIDATVDPQDRLQPLEEPRIQPDSKLDRPKPSPLDRQSRYAKIH